MRFENFPLKILTDLPHSGRENDPVQFLVPPLLPQKSIVKYIEQTTA